MSIRVDLDVMLARRKMSMTELSNRVGVTMANLSILKNGKAKAVRFSTLEAICAALDCQPGDILEFVPSESDGQEIRRIRYVRKKSGPPSGGFGEAYPNESQTL